VPDIRNEMQKQQWTISCLHVPGEDTWGRKRRRQKPGSSEVLFTRAVDKATAGDGQSQHECEWKLHSFLYRAEVCKQLKC